MSDHNSKTPYIFKNGNNHTHLCAKCGEPLQDGDKVVWRTTHDTHLGYLAGRHIVLTKHLVDAHGEPLYD